MTADEAIALVDELAAGRMVQEIMPWASGRGWIITEWVPSWHPPATAPTEKGEP